MSAIAVLRRDDGIVIACDSISYTMDGIVRSVRAGKVTMVPELGCVIGNTGVGNFSAWLRAQMGQKHDTFDEAVEGFADDFRGALQFMMERDVAIVDQPCTAFIAGWSPQRERFESYRISARDKEVITAGVLQTVPAGTLMPLAGDWCSHAITAASSGRFGLTREDGNVAQLAAGYIFAARASSAAADPAAPIDDVYAVGGELHIITVQRDQMHTFVAHRWPDMVGSAFAVHADDPAPEWLLKAA